MDRMQRVDKNDSASERNPSRITPLTEHRNNVSFRSAG